MTPGTPHSVTSQMTPGTPMTPQSMTPQSIATSPIPSLNQAMSNQQRPTAIPSLTPQMIRQPPIRELISSSMLLPSMSSRLTSELASIQYSAIPQTTDGMLAAAFQKTVVEGVEDNWSLPDIATYSSETQRHLVEIEKLFNA